MFNGFDGLESNWFMLFVVGTLELGRVILAVSDLAN
jgi:hypothetical protein